MTKIEQIKEAIEKADRFESKLSPAAMDVPMLGSLKIRHLMNNLGAISTRFLEVGSHRGGSFVSTVYDNTNLEVATAIDDYSENFHAGDARADFIMNAKTFTYPETKVVQISQDCFSVDPKTLDAPFDLYLYDGNHAEEMQRKAVTYFLDAMADEFIMVVDDAGWGAVMEGTSDGLVDAGVEILFEEKLWDGIEGNNEQWWNGSYVALLKKKI